MTSVQAQSIAETLTHELADFNAATEFSLQSYTETSTHIHHLAALLLNYIETHPDSTNSYLTLIHEALNTGFQDYALSARANRLKEIPETI